jgi:hypothetical protein
MGKVKLSAPVKIGETGEVTTIAELVEKGRIRFTKDEERAKYRAELIPEMNGGVEGFWEISATAYQSRTGEEVIGSASSESRMRQIRCPSGRVGEHVAKLTDDEKQKAAVKDGTRLGEDSTLKIFPTRYLMARAIRTDEKRAPRSQWDPVVPLGDGEGY